MSAIAQTLSEPAASLGRASSASTSNHTVVVRPA